MRRRAGGEAEHLDQGRCHEPTGDTQRRTDAACQPEARDPLTQRAGRVTCADATGHRAGGTEGKEHAEVHRIHQDGAGHAEAGQLEGPEPPR